MWSAHFNGLPCTLREGLVSGGLDNAELLAMSFGPDEPDEAYERLANQIGYAEDDGGELIRGLVDLSRGRALRTPSRLAAVTDAEIEVWATKRRRIAAAEKASAVQLPARLTLVPPPGKAPPARWPTRAAKKLAAATTTAAKDSADSEERDRWLTEARALAILAEFPLVKRTLGTALEGALKPALAQGVRTSTLRKRVRDAKKLSQFMAANHGIAWPQRVEHVLDYVLTRAAEPCGPSVPLSIQSALYFFEKGGGVAKESMMATDPLLVNVIADLLRDLRANRPMSVPAPREPVSLVAAREAVVLDASQTPYKRAYAWWKNIQVWAAIMSAWICRR